MIIVDTSVWIDHLRAGDLGLTELLENGRVLAHPFVTGEIALGSLRQRSAVLEALRSLPQATVASDDEALMFIETRKLYGIGIGYVDAHLLTAAQLTPGVTLWTRDRRLREASMQLRLSADLT
ncbi:VapC toxin family PIN domain ribonuclease [Microvirga sp. KLBC 81]|uniref:type II toxin-antitoxin system VapC family toxin n=1 Tax=Microvirga sp. KLBC 81 TaxID=1862707 RepID=UPI000D50C21E|nr:type II toxin-antitoxin system VapC family toxin [Microvirga sp. KLBC 81]PVE22519.1 VapC toxin family PIN domain ribonuclease [Microvirga sp. KLBC 81]